MAREVVASYPIDCIGSPQLNTVLKTNLTPVNISLTVYKDGHRDVGCPFLSDGICRKFGINHDNGRCKHLF